MIFRFNRFKRLRFDIWAKSRETGQIDFFGKIDVSLRKLGLVTNYGLQFTGDQVCFWF
jgi:hypothetical protein